MGDVYIASLCVCVHGRANEWVGEPTEPLYRRKTPCVSTHTHGSEATHLRSSFLSCIQYNYIQQTNCEINTVCIQSDYTGERGNA
jgi:hypothetical protein